MVIDVERRGGLKVWRLTAHPKLRLEFNLRQALPPLVRL